MPVYTYYVCGEIHEYMSGNIDCLSGKESCGAERAVRNKNFTAHIFTSFERVQNILHLYTPYKNNKESGRKIRRSW